MTEKRVGYGNPPEKYRFKKGVSPKTPQGRPFVKLAPDSGDLVDRALHSRNGISGTGEAETGEQATCHHHAPHRECLERETLALPIQFGK